MKNPHLSVIIPAYNEAERIIPTLQSVHTYLRTQDFSYEIIVVNDGSTDTTAQVVADILPEIAHMRLIDNKNNHGKGWVVRQGMLEAQGEHRLFMDADNSTTIDHIDGFLRECHKGTDVVISSRRIEGSVLPVHQSAAREFLGSVFRFIVRLIVPLGIVDSQNGFKLFTASAAEHIFKRQKTFTWAFDVEILAIARLSEFKMKEVPVQYIDDARSHMNLRGMLRMLREVIQVKYNLLSAQYGTNDVYFGDSRYAILTKFIIFGGFNTAIDWSWYFALTRSFTLFADHLALAKGVAFLIGSIPVFVGHAYWVFPKSSLNMKDQLKMYGILAAAFFINTFALSSLIALGWNDLTALIAATCASFAWNLSVAWLLIIKDKVGLRAPLSYESS